MASYLLFLLAFGTRWLVAYLIGLFGGLVEALTALVIAITAVLILGVGPVSTVAAMSTVALPLRIGIPGGVNYLSYLEADFVDTTITDSLATSNNDEASSKFQVPPSDVMSAVALSAQGGGIVPPLLRRPLLVLRSWSRWMAGSVVTHRYRCYRRRGVDQYSELMGVSVATGDYAPELPPATASAGQHSTMLTARASPPAAVSLYLKFMSRLPSWWRSPRQGSPGGYRRHA